MTRRRRPELVGVSEVAEVLGVSRQRVNELDRLAQRPTTRNPFPEPIARLRAGPVWDKRDVDAWQERRSR